MRGFLYNESDMIKKTMKTFHIITIFPDALKDYANESILKRAQEKKKIKIVFHDLRKYSKDKHKKVDDAPYGGGPGMIMSVDPWYRALKDISKRDFKVGSAKDKKKKEKQRILMMDPAGKRFDQKMASKFESKYDEFVFLCGRYEGFDARILKFVDERISVGDFVLSGGELPAMIISEAVSRLVPGVLGNKDTLREETFTLEGGEYPQYTRPESYEVNGKNLNVPKILLSGDHGKIDEWRKKNIKK